jgi:hypothetical protein
MEDFIISPWILLAAYRHCVGAIGPHVEDLVQLVVNWPSQRDVGDLVARTGPSERDLTCSCGYRHLAPISHGA